MLERTTTKPELYVEVPQNGKAPKAVVILFGWFGSKLRHVRKYAEQYEMLECATISCILDDYSVMVADEKKMRELSTMAAKEAVKMLQLGDKIPLICHAFSNGGGMPLWALEKTLEDKCRNRNDKDVEEWKLIAERIKLGAEIFDSAPAFPDFSTLRAAMLASTQNSLLGEALFLLAILFYYASSVFTMAQGKERWDQRYWAHWETCTSYAGTQIFIYSTADTITKSSKLDDLVRKREKLGGNVIVKRFEDSQHVQHMRMHQLEYCNVIKEVVSRSTK